MATAPDNPNPDNWMKSRNVRVEDELWHDFCAKVKTEEGEAVSVVLRRLMREYVRGTSTRA